MVDNKLSTKSLLFFLVFSAITLTFKAQVINQCEYEMVVNTGATRGPTSKLGVTIEAVGGSNINTNNIFKNWGVMGSKYTYFLPNSSDRFKTSSILPCKPRFCWIGIKGKKGELVPHWSIINVTITTKGEGIDRLRSFYFDVNDPIRTVYPYASDGECP